MTVNELNRSIVDFRIRTRITTEEELTNARGGGGVWTDRSKCFDIRRSHTARSALNMR